jgi:acetyl-CoA C-acetyltransferase
MDPRTPVIVGVGQVNGENGATEPLDLITIAAEGALGDCGQTGVPIDLVALSKIGTRQYANAPHQLAQRLGFPGARTMQANHGGHTAQVIVAHAASEIAHGRSSAVLVAGGEHGSRLKKGGHVSDDGTPRGSASGTGGGDGPAAPDLAIGDDLTQWIAHPEEQRLGITEPISMYPIMETALGAALGRERGEHIREISALWARFSEVASANEYADDRTVYTADEIGTPASDNRYVGYPYTKRMNSNPFVDQAAAILLCSVGVAEGLGIPRDRWVFPQAAVTAHEPFVSERWSLHDSPALACAGRSLEVMVDRPLREFEIVDLYACFPFAVQVQANALGIAPGADRTTTGGMSFAGGPWNNYATHMIANLVERVRERPEGMAVCSSNGGLATRFCLMAYSGAPSPGGFRSTPLPFADPGRRRHLETRPEGAGRVEGYTVLHDRANQPTHAIAACVLPNSARAWARLNEPGDLAAMLAADPIGQRVRFDGTHRLEG